MLNIVFLYAINLEVAKTSGALQQKQKSPAALNAAGLNAGSKRMDAPYGLEETVSGMVACSMAPSCPCASRVQVNERSVGGSGPPAFISWL